MADFNNLVLDHATGRFPGRGNPNRIAPQRHEFRVPLLPQAAATPTPLGMSPFGIAVNGVVLDPGAAISGPKAASSAADPGKPWK